MADDGFDWLETVEWFAEFLGLANDTHAAAKRRGRDRLIPPPPPPSLGEQSDPKRKARAAVHILVHAALYDGHVSEGERRMLAEELREPLRISRVAPSLEELTESLAILHDVLDAEDMESRVRELARVLDRQEREALLRTITRLVERSEGSSGAPYPGHGARSPREDPLDFFARALGVSR